MEEPPEAYRMLTGIGMRYPWGVVIGWRGEPEIRHRDAPLSGTLTTLSCPVHPLNDRCLAPLPDGWLALTSDGLVAITERQEPQLVGPVALPTEEPRSWAGHVRGPALHTSADGRYAATVTDYGRHGLVVDLQDARPDDGSTTHRCPAGH